MPSTCSSAQDPRLALFVESLRTTGRARIRLRGASMRPGLGRDQDVVVERASLEELRLGDIAVFFRDARLFAHRVVRRVGAGSGASWVTKGDALANLDPPLEPHELLGRVVLIEQGPHTVRLDAWHRRCWAVVLAVLSVRSRAWHRPVRVAYRLLSAL